MKVKAEENGYGEGTAGQAHRLDGTLVAPRGQDARARGPRAGGRENRRQRGGKV